MTQEEKNTLFVLANSILKREGYHFARLMDSDNNCYGLELYEGGLIANEKKEAVERILEDAKMTQLKVSYNPNSKNISIYLPKEKSNVDVADRSYIGGDR